MHQQKFGFNSLWPNNAIWHPAPWSILINVMASHNLYQCWLIVDWPLRNKPQWHCNWNRKLFSHKNAFENVVCKMAAILFQPQGVNYFHIRASIEMISDKNRVKFIRNEDNNSPGIQNRYHFWQSTNDWFHQSISNHNIDLVCLQ